MSNFALIIRHGDGMKGSSGYGLRARECRLYAMEDILLGGILWHASYFMVRMILYGRTISNYMV